MPDVAGQFSDIDCSVAKETVLPIQGQSVALVALVPASAGAAIIPAGADIELKFGQADKWRLDGSFLAWEMCKHSGGIKVIVNVAAAGTLRVWVGYDGGPNVN